MQQGALQTFAGDNARSSSSVIFSWTQLLLYLIAGSIVMLIAVLHRVNSAALDV